MSVRFTIINQTKEKIPTKRDFLSILNPFLSYFKIDRYSLEINLIIVTDEKMRKLNKKSRGKDVATDVLSFPLDITSPDSLHVYTNDATILLGDIYIAPCYAYALHSDTPEKTCERLFLHGLLHLIGLDHRNKKEERAWEKIVKNIYKFT